MTKAKTDFRSDYNDCIDQRILRLSDLRTGLM